MLRIKLPPSLEASCVAEAMQDKMQDKTQVESCFYNHSQCSLEEPRETSEELLKGVLTTNLRSLTAAGKTGVIHMGKNVQTNRFVLPFLSMRIKAMPLCNDVACLFLLFRKNRSVVNRSVEIFSAVALTSSSVSAIALCSGGR